MFPCLTSCVSRYPVLVAGNPGHQERIKFMFSSFKSKPCVDSREVSISTAFPKADDAWQDPGAIVGPHHQAATTVALGGISSYKISECEISVL